LIQDLIAKTDTSHPDHQNLSAALQKYENLMEYLDADICKAENRNKFLQMSKFKGGQVCTNNNNLNNNLNNNTG
jgi:hypothetical protein